MTTPAALPRKMADTKTIVLKSRLDSKMVMLLGEKLKRKFFVRLGFLKPRSQDIRMIYLDKYYEPYIIIGGKYALDYCKRHIYDVKVEDDTQEIFVNGKKLKCEPLKSETSSKVIKLEGEEHSHHEVETYFILDRLGREVAPENLPFAPFEERPDTSDEIGVKLRKVTVSLEKEIEFLRSRIAVRPSDIAEVIREIFDINERTVIYSPMYQLTFQNIKTGKEAIAIINGITSEVIFSKFNKKISGRIAGDFIEPLSTKTELVESKQGSSHIADGADVPKGTITDLKKDFNDQQPVSSVLEAKEKLDFPAEVMGDVFHVGDNVAAARAREYLKVKLALGSVSLVIGLLAANFALFNWVERTDLYYLLGNYARYFCAYGGFAAMIFGAMLINDFFVFSNLAAIKPATRPSKMDSDYQRVHAHALAEDLRKSNSREPELTLHDFFLETEEE